MAALLAWSSNALLTKNYSLHKVDSLCICRQRGENQSDRINIVKSRTKIKTRHVLQVEKKGSDNWLRRWSKPVTPLDFLFNKEDQLLI